MRKRNQYLAVALGAALFSINAFTASAAPTPSPSPSIDSFKAAHEQYKKDRDAYASALRDREFKMRVINSTFKSSVDKAALDARTAMNQATTPEQKNAIASIRRAAVAAAIVARENAIVDLGPLPTAPIEPVRPAKNGAQGMATQKDKQKR